MDLPDLAGYTVATSRLDALAFTNLVLPGTRFSQQILNSQTRDYKDPLETIDVLFRDASKSRCAFYNSISQDEDIFLVVSQQDGL